MLVRVSELSRVSIQHQRSAISLVGIIPYRKLDVKLILKE